MRRAVRVACLAGVALLLPAAVRAQPVTPDPAGAGSPEERLVSGVSLVHDNDNWPHPGNTLRDDNYSAGYELRVNGSLVRRAWLSKPLEGLDWLTGMRRLHARGGRRYHSASLVGLVYTPDVIQTTEVQTDDRPYASLMALTVSRTSVGGAALDRAWWSEFTLGMLGLDVPGEVQRLTHRTRRWMTGNPVPYDPLGWRNQISAGGEPTALYRAGYQRRLAGDGTAGRRKHWEVVGAVEGGVGYVTSAAGSIGARVGAFTSDFWEFPTGTASPAVGQQHAPAGGVRRWDVFAFALVRPRLVAYNAFVQGQFRDSIHTVRPRRVLGESEGGVGVSLPLGSFQVQAVMQLAQWRTADFVGPKARHYSWGSVGVLVTRPGRRD
ncbi:MAG: lipid A-modifier LpxR family protein [Vicinamibacterales bacterium]